MKGLAVREQKGTSVGDKTEARLRRAQPAGCLPRLENTHTSTHQLPKTGLQATAQTQLVEGPHGISGLGNPTPIPGSDSSRGLNALC